MALRDPSMGRRMHPSTRSALLSAGGAQDDGLATDGLEEHFLDVHSEMEQR